MSVETKRYFTATKDDGSKVFLTIRRPDRKELADADFEYSRVFNEALRNSLPTKQRQMKLLRDAGAWTADDEREMEESRKRAQKLEARVQADADKQRVFASEDERQAVQSELAKALMDFNSHRSNIEQMLNQTADAKAENAFRNLMLCRTIEYADEDPATKTPVNMDKVRMKDGKHQGMQPLWATLDELQREVDRSLIIRVMYEYQAFSAGLPSDFPEEEEETAAGTDTANAPEADPVTVLPAPGEQTAA